MVIIKKTVSNKLVCKMFTVNRNFFWKRCHLFKHFNLKYLCIQTNFCIMGIGYGLRRFQKATVTNISESGCQLSEYLFFLI